MALRASRATRSTHLIFKNYRIFGSTTLIVAGPFFARYVLSVRRTYVVSSTVVEQPHFFIKSTITPWYLFEPQIRKVREEVAP
jgi:hypothetical protein